MDWNSNKNMSCFVWDIGFLVSSTECKVWDRSSTSSSQLISICAGQPGFESRQGLRLFSLLLGPDQSGGSLRLVPCYNRGLFPGAWNSGGLKLTVQKLRTHSFSLPSAFVAWCLMKHRGNLTLWQLRCRRFNRYFSASIFWCNCKWLTHLFSEYIIGPRRLPIMWP